MKQLFTRHKTLLLLLGLALLAPHYLPAKKRTLRRKNPLTAAFDQADDQTLPLPTELAPTPSVPLITAPPAELLLDAPSATPSPSAEEVAKSSGEIEEKPLEVIEQKLAQEEEKIEFHFEDADLSTLLKQVEEIFDITFITDENLSPSKGSSKPIRGNKVSFKSNKALSQQEAFDLFLTFLNMAGLTIVATSDESQLSTQYPLPRPQSIFRIQSIEDARKSPIRAEIGTDPEKLPDSDEIIRYVYFLKNSTMEAIEKIIRELSSSASSLAVLNEHKAFMLTDRAYNIKTLMRIIKELDKTSAPESMSILKLKRADAQEVKELYQSIIKDDDQGRPSFLPKKKGASALFPEDTKIIAEPRTNSLILLGSRNAIEKIEEFVKTHVDKELDRTDSPLHTHRLKFAEASSVAEIMNEVAKFGQDTPAGKSGGVRGPDKYLKRIQFVAEKSTNSLIIHGDHDSYMMTKAAIEKLDEAPAQVAIEVLILSVNVKDNKELGTQLRSKKGGHDGLTGPNVKFQTSGMFRGRNPTAIKENTAAQSGTQRLLSNLIDLVVGAPAGNTIITLGQDLCGVWGIFQMLQTMSNLQVISNPFVIANNKAKSIVELGETRRVVSGQVSGTDGVESFDNEDAMLTIEVTPQINNDGLVMLDMTININEFADPDSSTDARKFVKKIQTHAIVADNEVLALGGLIRNKTLSNLNKTPLLGDIPLLGWLFKNRRKQLDNENLLILISTRIIKPGTVTDAGAFTHDRIAAYHGTLDSMHEHSERRDPINRVFFDAPSYTEHVAENLIFERGRRGPRKRGARRRNKKHKDAAEQLMDDAPVNVAPTGPSKDAQLLAKQEPVTPPAAAPQANSRVAQIRKTRPSSQSPLNSVLNSESEVST